MEDTQDFSNDFVFSGAARLLIRDGSSGPVRFNVVAADGCLPRSGEIFGNNDLLHNAWYAGWVTLAILNTEVLVRVLGRNSANGALIIDAVQFFGGLAAHIKHAA